MHRADKGDGFFTLYIIALSQEQQQKWVDTMKQGELYSRLIRSVFLSILHEKLLNISCIVILEAIRAKLAFYFHYGPSLGY